MKDRFTAEDNPIQFNKYKWNLIGNSFSDGRGIHLWFDLDILFNKIYVNGKDLSMKSINDKYHRRHLFYLLFVISEINQNDFHIKTAQYVKYKTYELIYALSPAKDYINDTIVNAKFKISKINYDSDLPQVNLEILGYETSTIERGKVIFNLS